MCDLICFVLFVAGRSWIILWVSSRLRSGHLEHILKARLFILCKVMVLNVHVSVVLKKTSNVGEKLKRSRCVRR